MDRSFSAGLVLAAGLALLEGGFMVADAVHRFVTGDFFRIDGQLGPWSTIISGLGIDPLAMGPVFLVLGAIHALAGVAILLRRPWGVPLTIAMAFGTLWYLIFGTISSSIQIVLLWVHSRARSPHLGESSRREGETFRRP